ncbi:hypothetical protein [Longimicrobium terrae]|uniref:Uncharacterized protein n=1 Tax=Longimicrobium terrae TaxID=1639882 RepID=A0A841GSV9_9BACT|nr:hypothetical protein [Longimicrobium terrae]MBB4636014.1 hypothetical protein [Longimicrobium terrae]MBB6070410.1 hypothetical protein [Longimicrobium terrae]NNC30904.1 hypothetical protein [Longimicrobium terrae]
MPSASVLVLSALAIMSTGQDSIRFNVHPAEISIGDTVTISWSAPGASSVFITGVGRASRSGLARVVPSEFEVTYVLSAEFDGHAEVRSSTVRVNGARGDGPDVSEMTFPYTRRCGTVSRSVNHVRERIYTVFQDSLWIEPVERRGDLDEIILETRNGSSRVIAPSPERRVRLRRVYFRVRIAPTLRDGRVNCSISSFVQFQRAGESTWYPEPDDSELHPRAAVYLIDRIRND